MRKSTTSFSKDIERYLENVPARQRKEEAEKMSNLLKGLKDNETTLKRYKVQDIILFLIAKKILMQDENDTERRVAIGNIHLRDILDKDTLSQKIRFSVKIQSKKGYVKTIKQDDLKLKDYAKFYRFLNDRRLPTLLDLVMYRTIERETIEKELDGYDKVHPAILEQVMKYEKDYYDSTNSSEYEDFRDMIGLDNTKSDTDRQMLPNIRNAFAHCAYPPYGSIGVKAQNKNIPEKAIAISDTFIEKMNKSDNENH